MEASTLSFMLPLAICSGIIWTFLSYEIEAFPLIEEISSNTSLSNSAVQPHPGLQAPLDLFLTNAHVGFRSLFLPPISAREPNILYEVYGQPQGTPTCVQFAASQVFDEMVMIFQDRSVDPNIWMKTDNKMQGALTPYKDWSPPKPYEFHYLLKPYINFFDLREVTMGFTQVITQINADSKYQNLHCLDVRIYKLGGEIVYVLLVDSGPKWPTHGSIRWLKVVQSSGQVTSYKEHENPVHER